MSIVSVIPVANMAAANATLQGAGYGLRNFSVPAYGATGVTHAALHAWIDASFAAAVKALPGVAWEESAGDPVARTAALISAQGAQWGAQAPMLPTTGNAIAGTLYRYTGDTLWWCIQTFSRDTFSAPPSAYPSLIRQSRIPGSVAPWVQPTDQFDAYNLVNPFTGQPDECTFGAQTWYVSQGDGAGNNTWQPGVFGWTVKP